MAISRKSPDASRYKQTKCINKNYSKTPNVMKLCSWNIPYILFQKKARSGKVSMFITIDDDRICSVKLAGAHMRV